MVKGVHLPKWYRIGYSSIIKYQTTNKSPCNGTRIRQGKEGNDSLE